MFLSEYRISIHAPAKGATTPCAEVKAVRNIFQSTLPRRERHIVYLLSILYHYFNPRSREGSDFFLSRIFSSSSYFNPRSREGSDGSLGVMDCIDANFNPRSREGSDTTTTSPHRYSNRFQSTLPRRERHNFSLICNNPIEFQSTLPRRERL